MCLRSTLNLVMKVLLLIAGQSTRFWPLADKNFFPICGKSLLEHQVQRLLEGGCVRKDIVIVGGKHNLQKAQSLLPHLQCIEQEDLSLGMRGALLSSLPSCGSSPVMIVSGNDVVDSSAYALLQKSLQKEKLDGVLLAQRVSHYFPGGYISLKKNRIIEVREKPGPGNEPSDLINIVVHLHKNASTLLDALQKVRGKSEGAYERALSSLFLSQTYHAVTYTGPWTPVKYPWHLLSASATLLSTLSGQKIHKTASLHPTAVVEGPVVLEEECRILAHATIVGPCYIGKGTVVANNALVRQSSIGEGCVVGYSTEVARSVLHSHIWTHMSYVGDSVIDENVAFGAGSITGNLRLDEQNIISRIQGEPIDTHSQKFGTAIGRGSRLGFSTGIQPGVKIGSQCFVNSGTIVSDDVPDGHFVSLKGGTMEMRPNTANIPMKKARQQFLRKI